MAKPLLVSEVLDNITQEVIANFMLRESLVMLSEATMSQSSYQAHLDRGATDYSSSLSKLLSDPNKPIAIEGATIEVVIQQQKAAKGGGPPPAPTTFSKLKNVPFTGFVYLQAGHPNLQAAIANVNKPGYVSTLFHPKEMPAGRLYIDLARTNNQALKKLIATPPVALDPKTDKIVSVNAFVSVGNFQKTGQFREGKEAVNAGDIYELVFTLCVAQYLIEGRVTQSTVIDMKNYILSVNGKIAGTRTKLGYTVADEGGTVVRRFNGSPDADLQPLSPNDKQDQVNFYANIGKLKNEKLINSFVADPSFDSNPMVTSQISNTMSIISRVPKFASAYKTLTGLMFNNVVDKVDALVTNSAAESEAAMKLDVKVAINFKDGRRQDIDFSLKDDSSQLESASPQKINSKLDALFSLGLTDKIAKAGNDIVSQLNIFMKRIVPALKNKTFTSPAIIDPFLIMVFRFVEQDDIPILLKASAQKIMSPGWFEYLRKSIKKIKFEHDGGNNLYVYAEAAPGTKLPKGFQSLLKFRYRNDAGAKRLSIDVDTGSILYTPTTWTEEEETSHSYQKYGRIISTLSGTDSDEYRTNELDAFKRSLAYLKSTDKPTKKVLDPLIVERFNIHNKFFFRLSKAIVRLRSEMEHSIADVTKVVPQEAVEEFLRELNVVETKINATLNRDLFLKLEQSQLNRKSAGTIVRITKEIDFAAVLASLQKMQAVLGTKPSDNNIVNMIRSVGEALKTISGNLRVVRNAEIKLAKSYAPA